MSISSQKAKAGGAPRWMVTFADLMSLLFAFFVLLLSFSEVDSDSFKKNASRINEAFQTSSAIQQQDIMSLPIQLEEQDVEEPQYRRAWREDLMHVLKTQLVQEINANKLQLIKKENSVTIRFPDTTAFIPGGADLSEEILPTLDKITHVLAGIRGKIKVAGHSDNIPVSSGRFRSNWDLSAARAVSVVHQILSWREIEPDRLTAQGFADSRPLRPNNSRPNRAKNRRVEISVELEPLTLK